MDPERSGCIVLRLPCWWFGGGCCCCSVCCNCCSSNDLGIELDEKQDWLCKCDDLVERGDGDPMLYNDDIFTIAETCFGRAIKV